MSACTPIWLLRRPSSSATELPWGCSWPHPRLQEVQGSHLSGGSRPPLTKHGAWAWAWASVQMAFWPQNSCPPLQSPTLPPVIGVRRKGTRRFRGSRCAEWWTVGTRGGVQTPRSGPLPPHPAPQSRPISPPLPASTQRLHRRPSPAFTPVCGRQDPQS